MGPAPAPSSKPLTGADFIARGRLTNKGGEVVALPGETCERVNPASLGWLEAQGYIEPRLTQTRVDHAIDLVERSQTREDAPEGEE